ncbi:hypothetical protein, partial [Poritiphilus flavus]
MKQRNSYWSRALICLLFTLISAPCLMAQSFGGYYIYGSSTVNVGEANYYSISGSNIASVSWSCSSNGTVLSSSNSGASVRFNGTSNGSVSASVQDSYGSYHYVSVSVAIQVRTPGNPTVSSNNCGQATISRSGTPPTGVRWYWQGKNSNGSSTSLGYGSSFTVNQGSGTYYIRAR